MVHLGTGGRHPAANERAAAQKEPGSCILAASPSGTNCKPWTNIVAPRTLAPETAVGAVNKPFAQHRHEISRIEAFSDAVFAFAVTLLVVSLEVPKTFNELMAAMSGFLAFAICFTLLFQVWWRHHTFFRRYGLEDAFTIAMTGCLLFVVLFYVYPLKFVFTIVVKQFTGGEFILHRPDGTSEPIMADAQAPRLMQVYGLAVIAVFTVFALLYLHAYRKRSELKLTPCEALLTKESVLSNLGIALIGVLSISIATVGGPRWVPISGFSYALIGFWEWGLGTWESRQRRRLG